jgi:hypothetical protein
MTLAYDCLHLFRWPPSVTMGLSQEEKAFVVAAIEIGGFYGDCT